MAQADMTTEQAGRVMALVRLVFPDRFKDVSDDEAIPVIREIMAEDPEMARFFGGIARRKAA